MPKKLLHEIILLNDKSTFRELYEPIEKYVEENFHGIVKVFHNPTRSGLIVSRMEGARKATGEVILFLDSHMEINTNFLPPLLHEIVLNPKTAAVPIIDIITHDTFEYKSTGYGNRGGFDWNLRYQWFPLLPDYEDNQSSTYQLPAMTGGAYAINREYFFELGGYDEGMFPWNGENYELSFKLHLCGGNIVQVPCSRVGHVNRKFKPYSTLYNETTDFSTRNLKRLVEVWFDDDFKHLYYDGHPDRIEMDAGDLTTAKNLKAKLNCKPFKYFLDVIAPDILKRFPVQKLPDFASGVIQNDANKSLCVDGYGIYNQINYFVQCSKDLRHPEHYQDFILTSNLMIKVNDINDICLKADKILEITNCHYKEGGNQFWKYELVRKKFNKSNLTCNN